MSNPLKQDERAAARPKFAVDRMLGRLAKWLRVLGQDAIYGEHLTGYGLIRAAWAEDRLILTRDRRLKQKQPPPFIFIESDDFHAQLEQVIRACDLDFQATLFTRCLRCNSPLDDIAKESVETLVPAYVFASQEKFSWCGRCRRVYWPATHHQQMVEELSRLKTR